MLLIVDHFYRLAQVGGTEGVVPENCIFFFQGCFKASYAWNRDNGLSLSSIQRSKNFRISLYAALYRVPFQPLCSLLEATVDEQPIVLLSAEMQLLLYRVSPSLAARATPELVSDSVDMVPLMS